MDKARREPWRISLSTDSFRVPRVFCQIPSFPTVWQIATVVPSDTTAQNLYNQISPHIPNIQVCVSRLRYFLRGLGLTLSWFFLGAFLAKRNARGQLYQCDSHVRQIGSRLLVDFQQGTYTPLNMGRLCMQVLSVSNLSVYDAQARRVAARCVHCKLNRLKGPWDVMQASDPISAQCPEPQTWGFTLDDGPNCSHNAYYDFLEQQNQKATLFYIGSNVLDWPLEGQRGLADGHEMSVCFRLAFLSFWAHTFVVLFFQLCTHLVSPIHDGAYQRASLRRALLLQDGYPQHSRCYCPMLASSFR
jgi:hypothetical protein